MRPFEFVQLCAVLCIVGRAALCCSTAGGQNNSSELDVGKRQEDCPSQVHVAAPRGHVGPALRSQLLALEAQEKLLHQLKRGYEKKRIPTDEIEDNRPPWICETRFTYQDLGQDYYPRYLLTAECPLADCWHGLYRCTPRTYKVKVLHKRSHATNDMCDHDRDQRRLPETLRHHGWKLEDLPITVCCECSYRSVA